MTADVTHGCRMPELDPAGVYSDPLNFPEGEESDNQVQSEAMGAFRQVLSFIASFFPDALPSESQPLILRLGSKVLVKNDVRNLEYTCRVLIRSRSLWWRLTTRWLRMRRISVALVLSFQLGATYIV